MSSKDDIEGDPWDVFDEALSRATENLDASRDHYQTLGELGASPPDGYVTALSDLEQDIERIDDLLDVTAEEAQTAVNVAQRATLLADVLSISRTFHEALIDIHLDLAETWLEALSHANAGFVEALDENFTVVQQLVAGGKYAQVMDNQQFSLVSCWNQLYEKDADIRTDSPDKYVEACLEAISDIEEGFTDDLQELNRAGATLRVKSERQALNSVLEPVREVFSDRKCTQETALETSIALQGAMMLKYQTTFARRAYTYCCEIADILAAESVAVDSLDELKTSRRVDELVALLNKYVTGETTVSDEERVFDLLSEHHGSLKQALAATDLGTAEFFDTVQKLYLDDQVVDIEVKFE
ncbi:MULTISPECIES: hypothetical protein [Haloferax]|uniref:Uncharacterized protein n=2 Tax=Haloferax TaxID=2251 RepID=A0A6G1Z7D9_9EURY|nr:MULTISPECIES: hypothetical protein [Haloferax]KAB1184834.1 hypothetical protein Hfx1149_17410 [Haloferax sp. CBA1149]MRW82470.1 hypothetical protein [Haloferax marinisediminis]